MLNKDDTKLEIFGFGSEGGKEGEDDTADNFYCLVNIKKNPEGIDLEKLSLADPRKFDEVLNRMGCILLLRGDEIDELIRRGEIEDADLHGELYELAVKEGFIS